MKAEVLIPLIVLVVTAVVPFALIAPSLMELFLGWDFAKDPEDPDQKMARGAEGRAPQEDDAHLS
jgi:hypothetical protein